MYPLTAKFSAGVIVFALITDQYGKTNLYVLVVSNRTVVASGINSSPILGFPKGSVNAEDIMSSGCDWSITRTTCAIRELSEETGVTLTFEDISRHNVGEL